MLIMNKTNAVLLLFTGGTISMTKDPLTGALRPMDFAKLKEYLPELDLLGVRVDSIPFEPFVDSSDVHPDSWERIARIIYEHYEQYDGFVVLHGTDTMAYTASAVSFMFDNLMKPVIFTGAQLPVGVLRSDAKENLLTAIEIATAHENGRPMVPEVCVFFEDTLFRGNRTTKQNATHFNAFSSFNYPPLAKAGVRIKYFSQNIHYPDDYSKPLELHTHTDRHIAVLKIFPGITDKTVAAILNIPNLRAVVLETFGSGNAPRKAWLHELLSDATARGLIIVNRTQCSIGSVEMGLYETSLNLVSAGVLSGYDITNEALVAKLMYLLGRYCDNEQVVKRLSESMCGEMTVEN